MFTKLENCPGTELYWNGLLTSRLCPTSTTLTSIILVLCSLGVLGNSLSLFIFTRAHFRLHSINVLLAALSAVDTGLLVLAIPVFGAIVLPLLLPLLSPSDVSHFILRAYPVTVMFQCASVWLLAIITVERYLAVCHPFTVVRYCTRRRALFAIFATLLLTISYNFVRFWEYGRDAAGEIKPLLRANPLFMILYQNVTTMLTQFIVPLAILCTLSIRVAQTIIKAGEQRRRLSPLEQREHNTAKMMLYVVIVFLACYLLSFILNVAEIVDSTLFARPLGHLLNDLNNILVIINSSTSLLFYWKYSTRFRHELNLLLSCIFCLRNYRHPDNIALKSILSHPNSQISTRNYSESSRIHFNPVLINSTEQLSKCDVRNSLNRFSQRYVALNGNK